MTEIQQMEERALYWENSAKSSRIEASRARDIESKRTHLQEAEDAEAFAKSVRNRIMIKKKLA